MPSEKMTVSDISAQIKQLASKVAVLEQSVSDESDLQTINKLDIINMKNELEKIKMIFPSINTDTLKRLQNLSEHLESSALADPKQFEKTLKEIAKSINELYSRTEKLESAPPSSAKPTASSPARASNIRAEIKSELKFHNKRFKDLENAIAKVSLEMKDLKKGTHRRPQASPGKGGPDIEEIKQDVKHLSERISGLKPVKIPENIKDIGSLVESMQDAGKNISSYKNKINRNTRQISSIKKSIEELKREIGKADKDSERDIERVKKETLKFILKELKKMVG